MKTKKNGILIKSNCRYPENPDRQYELKTKPKLKLKTKTKLNFKFNYCAERSFSMSLDQNRNRGGYFFMEDGRLILRGGKRRDFDVEYYCDRDGRPSGMKVMDRDAAGARLMSAVIGILFAFLVVLLAILFFDVDSGGRIVLRTGRAGTEPRMESKHAETVSVKTAPEKEAAGNPEAALRENIVRDMAVLALMAEAGREPAVADAVDVILSDPARSSVFLALAEEARMQGKKYPETIAAAISGTMHIMEMEKKEKKSYLDSPDERRNDSAPVSENSSSVTSAKEPSPEF